ncbi:DUF3558 domain-containing protein [Nocardia sp. NPDC024068]|uniref:DUF3558 domain-containing protein n=1 Tax=Nocardia sp. NPDC024068 TaxID=3157197 RepID=UPI0033DE5CF4
MTGCDATTGGTASPETTTDAVAATEALWDPCSQVSEDVLRQVGVDPSTRDNTISGVERVEGWKLCSWKDKPTRENYRLGVWSTTQTVEDSKRDTNNVGFTEVTLSGRSGIQFKQANDTHNEVCFLRFPADNQSIEISIYKAVSTEDERDPCDIAAAAAESLVPVFPS